MQLEWGKEIWREDADAAYAEAVRRVEYAAAAGDVEDRKRIFFSDLRALTRIPPGLAKLPDLREVYFEMEVPGQYNIGSLSALVDLSPLTDAVQISELDLRYTGFTDLAALSGLTGLTSLNLSDTRVTDLAALSGLTGLTSLDLSVTHVTDLAALSGLTGLTSLDLSGTRVADLAALSGLTGLTSLGLSYTSVADFALLLDIPAFAEERASFLQYNNTEATKNDRRLDLLSRLEPARCAIETVQYLKGTHPDFREPDGANASNSPLAALTAASPVVIDEVSGQLAAHDRGQPQRINPVEKEHRRQGQIALTRGLIEESGRAQVPSAIVRRLERYQEGLSVPEPIYFVIDAPMVQMRASLNDTYFTDGLEQGLVEGFRHLIDQHNQIRPLFLPPTDAMIALDEVMPEPSEDATPDRVIELVDETVELVNGPDTRDVMDASIADAIRAIGDLAVVAKERLEERPHWLKRSLGVLGGTVNQMLAFAGGVTGISTWAASPQGVAFFTSLGKILDDVLKLIGWA